MREKKALALSDSGHVALCFDFQKNLPLPLTNVGPEYYKRQLWVHNFNIHNMATEAATVFMYAEHFALKSPNEVISCLEFYIEKCLQQDAKVLHLFCDNCFGQNKNRYVFLYLETLVRSAKFEEVYMYFPVPGHSFMACDRDFGTIEKFRGRKDLVLFPSEWVKTVKRAKRQSPAFEVVYVQHPLTDDMEPDGTPIVNVKDFKKSLGPILADSVPGISKFRGLLFSKNGSYAKMSLLERDYSISFALLSPKSKNVNVDNLLSVVPVAYSSFLSVSEAKVSDVQYLLGFYDMPKKCRFYDFIEGENECPDYEEDEVEF